MKTINYLRRLLQKKQNELRALKESDQTPLVKASIKCCQIMIKTYQKTIKIWEGK